MESQIFKLVKSRGAWKAVRVTTVDELKDHFGVIDNFELAYPGKSERCHNHNIEIIPKLGQDNDLELNGWLFDKIMSAYTNIYKSEMHFTIAGEAPDGKEYECNVCRPFKKMNLVETVFNSMYLVSVCGNTANADLIINNVLLYPSLWDGNMALDAQNRLHELKPMIDELVNTQQFDRDFAYYIQRMWNIQDDKIADYLKECI